MYQRLASKIGRSQDAMSKGLRPRDQMCDPKRFKAAVHTRKDFEVVISNHASEFLATVWRTQPNDIRIGNQITIQNDSQTLWALLLVVSGDPISGDVVVRQLIRRELEPCVRSGMEPSGFSTEDRGLTDKWCIVRDLDGLR